jgi:hypothetical protein
MTPAEKAVIDQAIRWSKTETVGQAEDASEALQDLVADLLREREAAPDESMRPWSEIVTEDEIYSTKTGKWYRVLDTVTMATGGIQAHLEGVPTPFTNPATAEVRCRRGLSGKAVDVFIDVFRSGPS